MRFGCCAGVCVVCHDVSVETGQCKCVHTSGEAGTREPADGDLQGEAFMDPAAVNGQRVDFHLIDLLVVSVQMS